ncbi:hypothetical protein V8G54_005625 [Vigna mungo]|uniref:N-acetyltransferase domain-containing protein n=1 Tax=Vigna mungo TaxID=3915 RepID=A0AAQ3S6L6_VIGMU
MDSKFSPIKKNSINNDYSMKKKEELSMQLSSPPISKPSDEELGRVNRFEFGQFVAREAVLDEEYWMMSANDFPYVLSRYVDNYKKKFAEQEFHALKRRCKVQNGDNCACIITVRKEQKNAKHSILKSVVGTLDLNIRYLLQGETYPGERVKAPIFCCINRTPPNRYGYIANLCVIKSARRQGIASNMLSFAIGAAKSNAGVTQVYVHVDKNNSPAQILYQKMGFEVILLVHVHFSPSTLDRISH